MPRCFLHIQDGRDFSDDVGAVLKNADAVAASGESIKDHATALPDGNGWRMHVVDAGRATVCKLRLANMAE